MVEKQRMLTGTILFSFLGYLLGLFLSLGDDMRSITSFLQVRPKKSSVARQ